MTTPLTPQQLNDIDAAIAAYQQHAPTGFACCSAHPAADAARALVAEVRRLRDELAATRTKTLTTEADEIVAHCPDHGSRDTVWINCYCDVADDMRRRAAAALPV